jgi:hypothetical protein
VCGHTNFVAANEAAFAFYFSDYKSSHKAHGFYELAEGFHPERQ